MSIRQPGQAEEQADQVQQSIKTLIIIPTYNEAENLEHAITGVHEHLADADVLVVDDSSPDGTGDIADRLASEDGRVHVLHRATKDGLGGAYLSGFEWALDRDYSLIGEFDADGSHPAEALPRMRNALLQSDAIGLAIGSRWVRGGRVIDWPKSREVLSRGGNAYARLMLGLAIKDTTAGFRLYRSALLRRMDLADVVSKGYCFQIDLTVRTVITGAQVVEVPIAFRERELGVSKMSQAIVLEAMGVVTLWGLARILGRPGRWLAARAGRPVIATAPPAKLSS